MAIPTFTARGKDHPLIFRIEARGHVLHIEFSRTEGAPQPPDNAPQPMIVYPSEPTDPLYKLGPRWDEE